MRWLLTVILVLGLALFGMACQGEEEEEGEATATPTATQAASPEATATASPAADEESRLDMEKPLYIALGDSAAAGEGASDRSSTAYVPLFHGYLREALDVPGLELMNLGHGGDTSADVIEHGHLAETVDEIRARNFDESPDNDVQVVTLNIGGNDLIDQLLTPLVIPGTCPDLDTSLTKPECIDALQDTLDGFRENFDQALDELGQADPDLPVLTADVYNPFSGSGLSFEEVADWALEGREGSPVEEGLNDVIRSVAGKQGVPVADWYGAFKGKSAEFIAPDRIHANDAGYRVMTDALIAVYEASRD